MQLTHLIGGGKPEANLLFSAAETRIQEISTALEKSIWKSMDIHMEMKSEATEMKSDCSAAELKPEYVDLVVLLSGHNGRVAHRVGLFLDLTDLCCLCVASASVLRELDVNTLLWKDLGSLGPYYCEKVSR